MVAIKGKVFSKFICNDYQIVTLQMASFSYDGFNHHNCNYHNNFKREIPLLEMVSQSNTKESLIRDLQVNDNIEVECLNKVIHYSSSLIKESKKGQEKYITLKIHENLIYLEGNPCSTISLVIYNPPSNKGRNWVKSTESFVEKLIKTPIPKMPMPLLELTSKDLELTYNV